jgi:hypothetical protein
MTALSSAPNSSTTFVSQSHTSRITAPANAPYVAEYDEKFET